MSSMNRTGGAVLTVSGEVEHALNLSPRMENPTVTFTRSLAILALSICLCTTAAYADEPSCPGGYANRFRLNGQVQKSAWFRLIDLQYRPSSRVTVSYFSGSSGFVTKSYIGVPLIDLLKMR